MSKLNGIFVSLTTGNKKWSGTDDHLYIGLAGTVGGREFAPDVKGFNDFEKGTVVTYSIGPGALVFGGRVPATAPAALSKMTICQPNITHVYIRKLALGTVSADDAWTSVVFNKTFTDPIVMAKSVQHNGSDPAVVRIRSVRSPPLRARHLSQPNARNVSTLMPAR